MNHTTIEAWSVLEAWADAAPAGRVRHVELHHSTAFGDAALCWEFRDPQHVVGYAQASTFQRDATIADCAREAVERCERACLEDASAVEAPFYDHDRAPDAA